MGLGDHFKVFEVPQLDKNGYYIKDKVLISIKIPKEIIDNFA